MDNSKQSKQILLSVIGVAILVVAVVGVSFAFFNYTRTGVENTVSTGKIYFNHTQTGTIELTNVFPLTSAQLSTQSAANYSGHKDYAEVVIGIQGATTYSQGLDYRVSAQGVDFKTSTNVVLPVNVEVTAASLGTTATTGDVDRCVTTSYTSATPLRTGDLLAEGHIASNDPTATWNPTRVNGTLTVKAYIDASKIAISDTLAAGVDDNSGLNRPGRNTETNMTNGTPGTWVNGRLVLTTDEWNTLASDTLKFSIRVESKEADGTYPLSLS